MQPGHGRGAMILVTGATGNSGREVIRQLSEMGAAFKAMVRKETDREALAAQGIAAVVGDYRDPGTAVRGLDRGRAGLSHRPD